MNYTRNFNLRLPERNEQFNLDDWNNNTNSIDSAMQTNKTNISNNATNITSILTGLSTVNTEDTSSIFYKLMKLIYPVGSIYWSGNSTNPGTLFGGTWTQIKDRFVLACGDTYKSVSATGGASSITLAVANLPSHNHSFTPSGSVSSHTHNFTPEGTVSSTFTGTAVTTGAMSGNSTGTMKAQRIITADKDNTDAVTFSGNMSQLGTSTKGGTAWSDGRRNASGFKIDVSHTHSVTAKGTVSSSFTGTAGTTGSATPTFTGTAGNTGSTGSGTSFSILPPYIVKYCWQRTE